MKTVQGLVHCYDWDFPGIQNDSVGLNKLHAGASLNKGRSAIFGFGRTSSLFSLHVAA